MCNSIGIFMNHDTIIYAYCYAIVATFMIYDPHV